MKEGRGPRIARIGSFQRDATLLLPLISELNKLARRKGSEISEGDIFGGREHRLGDKSDRIARLSSGYQTVEGI